MNGSGAGLPRHRNMATADDMIPTLVLSAAKAGHFNQCLALCEAMGWQVDETITLPGTSRTDSLLRKTASRIEHALKVRQLSPPITSQRLRIVAGGSSAEPLVARYRRSHGRALFAVFIGAPKAKAPIFDVAIASYHAVSANAPQTDRYYSGSRRTIWMPGVPVRQPVLQTADSRPEVDQIAVLVGGNNKAYEIIPTIIAEQLQQLLSRPGCAGLAPVIAFSRRTPAAAESELISALQETPATFINRTDRHGFEQVLATAARFAITPDSITMICEACATGRPVDVFDLPCFNEATSTARFIRQFAMQRCIGLAPHNDTGARNRFDWRGHVINKLQWAYADWDNDRIPQA